MAGKNVKKESKEKRLELSVLYGMMIQQGCQLSEKSSREAGNKWINSPLPLSVWEMYRYSQYSRLRACMLATRLARFTLFSTLDCPATVSRFVVQIRSGAGNNLRRVLGQIKATSLLLSLSCFGPAYTGTYNSQ